ncbi:MAG: VOC family protein [Meiothermus sp.]|nr:VOC family protein [Meiothermus sp.]
MNFNALIPELTVSDLGRSLEFYLRLGFRLEYGREGFAFLSLQGAQLMLEQFHETGWNTGELVQPFGRGVNFQLEVEDLSPMLAALRAIDYPLYRPPYETWRRVKGEEIGEAEFLVQDPDGYLLRFSKYLGGRPLDR